LNGGAIWEVGCVTYPLDWNILNQFFSKDLRKTAIEEKAYFMSFYVRASDPKDGKFDARQLLREGIWLKTYSV
jgi:hypothetical protein